MSNLDLFFVSAYVCAMRLLVSGGRDFHDVDFIVNHLTRLHSLSSVSCLIHGAAKGVDTYCGLWAEELGIPVEKYPITKADWEQHGKSAGPRRNLKMLQQSRPDGIAIFPGGRGTSHMAENAHKTALPIWESKEVLFRKEDPKTCFLSNFYEGAEFYDSDGVVWPTSEHYYQAQKSENPHYQSLIQGCSLPNDAKQMSKTITARSDWHPPSQKPFGGYKETAMREALAYKFTSSEEMTVKLLDTHPHYLVEHAPWGDSYWGNYNNGLNRLGQLLMELRDIMLEEIT